MARKTGTGGRMADGKGRRAKRKRPVVAGSQPYGGATEYVHVDGAATGAAEHGDTPHEDTPHSDTPHDDTPEHEDHGDGHIDTHVDEAHNDGYWDVVHNDSARPGPEHWDSHTDGPHADAHADSGPDTDEPGSLSAPLPLSGSASDFFARLEVALERHEDRLVRRLEAAWKARGKGPDRGASGSSDPRGSSIGVD